MNGTKIIIRSKINNKKRTIYFTGVPKQFHLYLALQGDSEFCPFPMDNDSDSIKNDYDNVTVEQYTVKIFGCSFTKRDHAAAVFKRDCDNYVENENLNQCVWTNVPEFLVEELIGAIGGIFKNNNYYLTE